MTSVTKSDQESVFVKPKHEVPDPLEVESDRVYAFTINPKDAVAPIMKESPQDGPSSGFALVLQHIHTVLRNCRNIEFSVVPEVSKHGRIHAHGWCWFKHVAKAYIYDIPLLEFYSTICIKPLKEASSDECPEEASNLGILKGWEAYVYKSHNLMKHLCVDANLPYEFNTQRVKQAAVDRMEDIRKSKGSKSKLHADFRASVHALDSFYP